MKTKENLWKFSPSGLYGYEDCPACFWAENHIGRHPFTLPLRLNDAMDERLKIRYDGFRKKNEIPPEIREQLKKEKIRLFEEQEKLDLWRSSVSGLRLVNEKDGYVFEGKIDELFVNDKNEVIPADYKSSGDEPKEDKQKYYRMQIHAYAMMLREKGYKPAGRGYLIHYFTKNRKDPSINMEFTCHLDKIEIDLSVFEKKMKEIVEFLENDFPGANLECHRCAWLERRKNI
ncbi:MAG: PD-(D/E)XK nuclease family protein [Candidatus Nealsonbacteria bacterium]|nr:PD-(D/E)XK nuclease family protein [Candidatus Nealsonbacteria bacterium]